MANRAPEGSRITNLKPVVDRLSAVWDAITGRQFNPGKPLPSTFDETEQTQGPRQFDYPFTSNIIVQPRADYPQLTPFEQLRNLARTYDVAALCISTRIQEIIGLDWSIVVKDKKKASQQQSALGQQSETIQFITEFFQKPNQVDSFSDWLSRLLRDVFEIDALCLYINRDPDSRHIVGLDWVDGATIKPIIDDRGRVVAYQQIIKGLPASGYRRWGLGENFGPIIQSPYEGGDDQELIYRPRNVRTDNPYGMSPTEFALLRINMALRKQTYDLAWFTDGNIPEMLLSPPTGTLSVDQVAKFEQWFNSVLAGVDETRRKARFLAWDAKPTMLKEFRYETVLDEWMMKITCAAYDVTPAELGFTSDVNRATSQGQENIQYRKGIKPLTKWLKQLFDEIIATEFGHSELEFVWSFGEQEDSLAKAKEYDVWLKYGVVTPQEARALNFGTVLDDLAPPQMPAVQPPMLPSGNSSTNNAAQSQQDNAQDDNETNETNS